MYMYIYGTQFCGSLSLYVQGILQVEASTLLFLDIYQYYMFVNDTQWTVLLKLKQTFYFHSIFNFWYFDAYTKNTFFL